MSPQLRLHAPLALHVLTGGAAVGYALQVPCGSDECLGPLFTAASAGVWAIAVPAVLACEASRLRGVRIAAWTVPGLCLPVAWAFALALFVLHPGLGGA